MNFKERKKILLGFDCVDKVSCVDKDNTVCQISASLRKNEIDILQMVEIEKMKKISQSLKFAKN